MWLQIKGKWWLLFISISKAGLEKHGKDFITLMAATSLCLLLQCKNLKLTHKNNSTLFNAFLAVFETYTDELVYHIGTQMFHVFISCVLWWKHTNGQI